MARPGWPCLGYQSLKTSQGKGGVRTFSLHLHPPQLPWCAVQLFSRTFTQVTVLERSVTVFALFSSLTIYLHSLKIAPGPKPEYKGILLLNSVQRFSSSDLGVFFSYKQKLLWRALSFTSSIQRDIQLTSCHSQIPPHPLQAQGAALRALKFSAKTSTVFWREKGLVFNPQLMALTWRVAQDIDSGKIGRHHCLFVDYSQSYLYIIIAILFHRRLKLLGKQISV